MDIDALRTFLAIHRAGGFSAAAARLHRSQPAISRRIAVLEDEIGAPVFERTSAGVVLSQAGLALLPHAERVLAALDDAGRAVAELRAGGGAVSLAVVGTLAGAPLGAVLKRFAAAAPGVALTLQTATSREVSERVRRGEATLGVRYFEDRSSDLECHAMPPEALVVICAPSHPRAGARVAGLADLANEHWLAFPRRGEGEVAAETLSAHFLVRRVAEIRWTPIDSLTAQKRLVEAGYGVGLMPRSSVAEELAAGALAQIGVDDLEASNPVFAVHRRGAFLSAASRELLDLLTEREVKGAA